MSTRHLCAMAPRCRRCLHLPEKEYLPPRSHTFVPSQHSPRPLPHISLLSLSPPSLPSPPTSHSLPLSVSLHACLPADSFPLPRCLHPCSPDAHLRPDQPLSIAPASLPSYARTSRKHASAAASWAASPAIHTPTILRHNIEGQVHACTVAAARGTVG